MMQLFMTFYVLATLFIVANFLNIMLKTVVDRHQALLQKQLISFEVAVHNGISCRRDARKRCGRFNELIVSGVIFLFFVIFGTIFYRLSEHCTCSYGVSRVAFQLKTCSEESYEICVATGGITHDWISAFYMSVITVTTVGFGDFTPKSVLGRSLGIVWMLTGVSATAFFLQSVSKAVYGDPSSPVQRGKQRKLTMSALDTEGRQISIESLAGMDRDVFNAIDLNGSGSLTKAEYTRYVLVKNNYLPIDILRAIDDKFDTIDLAGTGSVTYDMIEEAKQRTASAEDLMGI